MLINRVNISNLTQMPDLTRILNPFLQQVSTALQNNLNFTDNIRASIVVASFGSTTSKQIAHGLAATPIGYLAIRRSTNCVFYDGNSMVLGATFANISCSVAGTTATLLFF